MTNKAMLWTDEEKQTLKMLWKEKYTAQYIGEKLGRKPQAIRQYVSRHKEELGLKPRDFKNWKNVKTKLGHKRFIEDWSGSVPYLHWTITKPWGKQK